jgi:1,4-alpha-glucan branching enzyme
MPDPLNKNRLPDGVNDFNSVISLGKPYLFKLDGFKNAGMVELMGSFNGWKRKELIMARTSTGWELPYFLGTGNYEYKIVVDGKFITHPGNPIVTNKNAKDANSFLVIDPNYTFILKGFSNARSIYLTGDFNNWNELSLPMTREGNVWKVAVNLSLGKHLYKYIVDGKWIIDPDNKLWEENEYGTGNSVLWIEKK